MEDAVTLRLDVNPEIRQNAEAILGRLGISLPTAVNMFLHQISLTGGIPFAVALPKAPDAINMDKMSDNALRAKLRHSLEQAEHGETDGAIEAFAAFAKVFCHESI